MTQLNCTVLMEGPLLILSTGWKSWKKRYFVLYNNKTLLQYKNENDYQQKKNSLDKIDLNGFSCSEYQPKKVTSKKFYFKLNHFLPLKPISFSTEDLVSGKKWAETISNALKKKPTNFNTSLPITNNNTKNSTSNTNNTNLTNITNSTTSTNTTTTTTQTNTTNQLQTNTTTQTQTQKDTTIQTQNQSQEMHSFEIPSKFKEKQTYYLDKITYVDSMNFISEEYYCRITTDEIELLPINDNVDKTKIPISTLQRVHLMSDSLDEFKILLRSGTSSPPIFLISNSAFKILTIFSILIIFTQKTTVERTLQNGHLSNEKSIIRFLTPLLQTIFSIIVRTKQESELEKYHFEYFANKQEDSIGILEKYFQHKTPLLLFSELKMDNSTLLPLTSILQIICFILPKPIFFKDTELSLSEIFDQELSEKENIQNFHQIYFKYPPLITKIMGQIFLIAHLIIQEYEQNGVLNHLAIFLNNLITFFQLPIESDLKNTLDYKNNQINFITFLIQQAPNLFYDNWVFIKERVQGREIEVNEQYESIWEDRGIVFSKKETTGNFQYGTNLIFIKNTFEKKIFQKSISRDDLSQNSELASLGSLDNSLLENLRDSNSQGGGSGSVSSGFSKNREELYDRRQNHQIKNKIFEELDSDLEEQTNEDRIMKHIEIYFDKPLPLLPITEQGIEHLFTHPLELEFKSEKIDYLYENDFQGIWNIAELLELFHQKSNPNTNSSTNNNYSNSNSNENENYKNLNLHTILSLILEEFCFEIPLLANEILDSNFNVLSELINSSIKFKKSPSEMLINTIDELNLMNISQSSRMDTQNLIKQKQIYHSKSRFSIRRYKSKKKKYY
ncbi:sesquipedalian [Anaeramoeba flamelloides]|uniref:Sesquipedalian n=1 Tax=Anaeramoeba flamelloides TaxID=1746091 RepID=A0AAV7Z3G7_9EUKA|nr:sesquipedalian [Anaeramoeba flamelloides]